MIEYEIHLDKNHYIQPFSINQKDIALIKGSDTNIIHILCKILTGLIFKPKNNIILEGLNLSSRTLLLKKTAYVCSFEENYFPYLRVGELIDYLAKANPPAEKQLVGYLYSANAYLPINKIMKKFTRDLTDLEKFYVDIFLATLKNPLLYVINLSQSLLKEKEIVPPIEYLHSFGSGIIITSNTQNNILDGWQFTSQMVIKTC